ncbi:zonular occludens toxin domain-containing protein [Rugamonas sp. DEMB1]|uniref:zonular occludens toxin domain-containing protein n=1 Tax=Rugamonas sp. DEMB1 TaxID=3039386 RepID=UPI0024484A0A|nr:zonular occludens toxin domain-containing protein [Rugamonas sp. DEMB1]WGG50321.1 zonular occludens toxin domain-containing protein [Rugamonas sp. DEMB1]
MAVYAITGKLGSGKGKGAMKLLRDYLRAGKRVATNCDVFMEYMMPAQSKATVIRVPDKPTSADLYAIGSGNRFIDFVPIVSCTAKGFEYTPPSPRLLPGFDESHNGALFLDECASWLNTRSYQDKGRSELLEWAIHARKYGWDVYFICQNISQIDKQLRDSLFEYVVRMSRLDRMKVPFVSAAFKLVTAGFSDGSLPRWHIGVVRLGCSPEGIVADRWHFRGDDLNKVYNTTQVFSDSYPHAIHCLLPSWHLQARTGIRSGFVGPIRTPQDYELLESRPVPPKPPHKHMSKFLAIALLSGLLLGVFGAHYVGPILFPTAKAEADVSQPVKYSETLSGKGYFSNAGSISVILSDGRLVSPLKFKSGPVGWEAEISEGLWVKGGTQ